MNREERIFQDIDKLLIDGSKIDEYETEEFQDEIKAAGFLKDEVIDFLYGEKKPNTTASLINKRKETKKKTFVYTLFTGD